MVTRLRVDWLDRQCTQPGRLGLTLLPGRADRGRQLSEDLEVLRWEGVTHVICLLTDPEFAGYGVPDLLDRYGVAGLEVRRLPILDGGVSTLAEMQSLIQWLTVMLQQGASLMVHCVGGLGRSGTVAACYLISRGWTAAAAVAEVRRVRSPQAVETSAQEEFVRRFAAAWL